MRKFQQQKILEMLQTLSEANSEIKRFINRKEYHSVIQILTGCQEFSVSIGNFIERIKGEGTQTVTLLEEYCTLLYKAGLEVNNQNSNGNYIKRFQKQLIKIENSVLDELKPDKIEIVFFPYKAAMFDSMESIWSAAKDDPQCDAYVIPIPYFDKLPDGGQGQIRYEGSMYPEYVPVVDWRKYNIEERHPDITVIHYPYDDGNYVTSIHPDFYSERLKNFTDLLVYVPYFVSADDVPEHFCVCCGTLYADKIIVQSENIRQTYIRKFSEFERENNCKGRFGKPEEKFIALGSPKFDKVVTTSQKDFQIPAGWKNLIENSDGIRKKVVFYNTSIAGLLNGNEMVLQKLQYVFECLRNRDDVVLLWRPHPLNEATYQAMRPQLLSEYTKIVEEYKCQGFGVYDDTPDPHGAIAISDAYFGDWSSLVALYQLTGKPVMIQAVNNIPENECFRALAFENLHDDGEFLWFTSFNFNALFRMDKQTWKAEFMGSFPEENMAGRRLYSEIIENNGKMFFIPYSAEDIAVYDLKTKAFSRIKLDIPEDITHLPQRKFSSAVFYKKWIFLLPLTYPSIVRYDVESGELAYYSDWAEPFIAHKKDTINAYIGSSVAVGKYIYAAAIKRNAVLVFDMDTCTYKIHTVGDADCCFFGICYDGKDFWLSPKSGSTLIKWNEEKNQATSIQADLPDRLCEGDTYRHIACVGTDVFVFPLFADKALKIDIESEIITESDIFQPECEREQTNTGIARANYIMGKAIGDVIYAHTGKSNRFITYNVKTGRYREDFVFPDYASESAIRSLIRHKFFKEVPKYTKAVSCCFYEKDNIELNDYLSFIVNDYGSEITIDMQNKKLDFIKSSIEHADGSCGEAIFSYCKKTIKQ